MMSGGDGLSMPLYFHIIRFYFRNSIEIAMPLFSSAALYICHLFFLLLFLYSCCCGLLCGVHVMTILYFVMEVSRSDA